ncbi:MAG: nucleotide exchange factor GrpE [Bacteroidota bacterium]|nr:nucleotide exchange factor GrpE [Bacteroidota bacterium]MDP4217052.1 nucleotide exchange factor GrpE [Bacteroidota bacterium]MDP4244499.1 nucleotide exchange factor GrpE [Bacteroidota bacterium]MDP4256040.1 nucleotide exchange factor GrpE [Bacteroidota bacterium]MDP4258746.1 nucleotide exchange factor GrpE [Bacteroidota bacterium]
MKDKDVRSSQEGRIRKGWENNEEAPEELNTDENLAGTTHLNDDMDQDTELDKVREELQEQKEKYIRLFAEFDNFRKRSARENYDLRQTAGREVIVSLLDVLDDCDRAEKQLQAAENIDQVKEGVMLVFSKLRSALFSKGLKAMQSIHTDFDVEKHEAITEVPVQDESLKGKVIDEVQKGYYLGDKIIRHAKVVVGK